MSIGKLLIVIGLIIALVGLALSYAPWLVNWFGRLPGDIRVERENGVFFFPITSMIVISLLLTLIVNLFFRR
ncbi:MAG: DUF2905 domain-containing protein [Gammaproteobacteria bacterium]